MTGHVADETVLLDVALWAQAAFVLSLSGVQESVDLQRAPPVETFVAVFAGIGLRSGMDKNMPL